MRCLCCPVLLSADQNASTTAVVCISSIVQALGGSLVSKAQTLKTAIKGHKPRTDSVPETMLPLLPGAAVCGPERIHH